MPPWPATSHPREEHLLPLHVCCGITQERGKVVFDDQVIGKQTCSNTLGRDCLKTADKLKRKDLTGAALCPAEINAAPVILEGNCSKLEMLL